MSLTMLANFIPDQWFAGFEQDRAWMLWLLCAAAIVLLSIGADRVVAAAVRLATVLGMSKVIIGATIVSLGTTTPEMFTSVTASFAGKSGLALGNGIGSIICDTGLIFGLAACIRCLPVDKRIQARHGRLQLLSGVLLAALVYGLAVVHGGIAGLVIHQWVGFVLVALLVGYLWISVHWARQFPDLVPAEAAKPSPAVTAGGVRRPRKLLMAMVNLLILAAGLAMVIFGSNLLVGSASALCHKYGVPESVLAATLVAFGTSLPELVTAVASLIRGHADLLIGNIMGADILNVLFVVGLSATATPLKVDRDTTIILLPAMLLVLVMLRVFVLTTGDRMKRWHGVALLSAYAAYAAVVITVGASLD